MRGFLVLALATALSAAAPAAAETGSWRYTESNGPDVAWIVYTVERGGDGVRVTSEADRVRETAVWRPGIGTVSWRKVGSHPGTDLRVRRQGATLVASGRLKGSTVAKEIPIDAAPWYQIIGPGMADLLPADASQTAFWVIDPDSLIAHRMVAVRMGDERVDVKHVAVSAARVHVTIGGAFGAFWGADYWYRLSDRALVHSRVPENGGITTTDIDR